MMVRPWITAKARLSRCLAWPSVGLASASCAATISSACFEVVADHESHLATSDRDFTQ